MLFFQNALAGFTYKIYVLLGGMFLFFLAGVGTVVVENSERLSASLNVDIPFDSDDAGLLVETSGEDIVSQTAPDDGADQMVNILVTVFHGMKWVIGFLALLWVIISGVYMVVNSSDESEAGNAKNMMKYALIGLAVMLLVEPLVLDILIGGGNGGLDSTAEWNIDRVKIVYDNFTIQTRGILDFIKTLLVFVAMAYIIMSGVKMMTAFGEEDQLSSAKSMFFPIVLGLLVIAFNEFFVDYVLYNWMFDGEEVQYAPDGDNARVLIETVIEFLLYILGFLALIAFVYLLYGGFLYIASMGDDDKASEGKEIIINAVIGFVIIMFSYVLMMSILNFSIF